MHCRSSTQTITEGRLLSLPEQTSCIVQATKPRNQTSQPESIAPSRKTAGMAARQIRPSIPAHISSENVVATVTIHDPNVPTHVQDTAFSKTNFVRQWSSRTRRKTIVGAHIFLLQEDDK